MMKIESIGKLSPKLFDELIFPYLGKKSNKVIIGPKHGVDAAVIDLGEKVMVIAEDPTFGLPSLGFKEFGWAIVHICCSDVACLGAKPEFMTICLLFPPKIEKQTIKEIMTSIHEECLKLEISLVGGHTGVYPGITLHFLML